MSKILTTGRKHPFRVGAWLPSDQAVLEDWLDKTAAKAKAEESAKKPLAPVLVELQQLIEGDPELYMLFTQMFEQVPHRLYAQDRKTGARRVKSYQAMLRMMNAVLGTAPEYNSTGLVGFPINAILDWAMGTTAGASAFLNEKVNAQLKKVINAFAAYLNTSGSASVLNKGESGWLSEAALAAMKEVLFGQPFDQAFKCNPEDPHYGYKSWDDFFTREFRDGVRKVASPDDDRVIASACESAPYKIQYAVNKRDKFWIKAQPYSLEHMFAGDPLYEQFVGGTIYQAFLSALSYHRWNSPVSGKIVKTHLQPGTYYAEAPSEGFDPAGPNESQGYITEVAARAFILIEADNPDIGLMCFMPVGMAEVSSCDITVHEGQHVKKGEQLGMFHFGGSTHCLMFRPGVQLAFDTHGMNPGIDAPQNIPVRSRLATVVK